MENSPNLWLSLLLSGLVLGGIAAVSSLLSKVGIRLSRAERTSILEAAVPFLTAVLAWVMIQRTMQLPQIFGLLLVILGVAALNVERSRRRPQPAQSLRK